MRPLSDDALSAVYGFAGLISPIPTGMRALQIRVRAELAAKASKRTRHGALAIAQQAARDFLTAKRASVSVKGADCVPA
jgi:hypothetical protein